MTEKSPHACSGMILLAGCIFIGVSFFLFRIGGEHMKDGECFIVSSAILYQNTPSGPDKIPTDEWMPIYNVDFSQNGIVLYTNKTAQDYNEEWYYSFEEALKALLHYLPNYTYKCVSGENPIDFNTDPDMLTETILLNGTAAKVKSEFYGFLITGIILIVWSLLCSFCIYRSENRRYVSLQ
jgi:hypothetical protein